MIRLLLADDHQVVLDGFKAIFDAISDMKVIVTASNGNQVLHLLQQHEVDIVIMDINMPELNGVETCKKLSKDYPSIRVIALSMHQQLSYVRRMIQYGAKGYLLKRDPSEVVETAIRKVYAGEQFISPKLEMALSLLTTQYKDRSTISDVTNREREVLLLIADGLTDQEIGKQLFVSHHTVKSHRKNLLQKFNAKNTAELVKMALEKGLI